jgi:formylglycine-generating enzyme required for sulfatase activity
MSGNVWEWVEDSYDKEAYSSDSHKKRNPVYIGSEANFRVFRGGSWLNNNPQHMRCSFRNYQILSHAVTNVGFRLVLEE